MNAFILWTIVIVAGIVATFYAVFGVWRAWGAWRISRAGPRPLRTMWRIARDQLEERYGQMTIGEVIDRYGRGGGSSGPSA